MFCVYLSDVIRNDGGKLEYRKKKYVLESKKCVCVRYFGIWYV